MILVGEASLRRAVGEFIEHYRRERNHQRLGNQLIVPMAAQTIGDNRILSRKMAPCGFLIDREAYIAGLMSISN
jgi:hypothetical protein